MLSTLSDQEGTSKPIWLQDGQCGLFKDANVRNGRKGQINASTAPDGLLPRGNELPGAGVGLLRESARGLLGTLCYWVSVRFSG